MTPSGMLSNPSSEYTSRWPYILRRASHATVFINNGASHTFRKTIFKTKKWVILVNSFKIDSFFSFKDRLPKGMRSSLIYKSSCVRCTSEYIGSTTRILTTRVAEHAGRSHRTDRILANPPHSNIRDHAETCGSPIVLDNFNIIYSCNNSNDLRILESLYIHKERPFLNNMQSAHPLYIVSKWVCHCCVSCGSVNRCVLCYCVCVYIYIYIYIFFFICVCK